MHVLVNRTKEPRDENANLIRYLEGQMLCVVHLLQQVPFLKIETTTVFKIPIKET